MSLRDRALNLVLCLKRTLKQAAAELGITEQEVKAMLPVKEKVTQAQRIADSRRLNAKWKQPIVPRPEWGASRKGAGRTRREGAFLYRTHGGCSRSDEGVDKPPGGAWPHNRKTQA